MKNIKIIGAPFRSGCNREGAQLGPIILREMLDFGKDDWEFINIPSEIMPLSELQDHGVKNFDSIINTSITLRDIVSRELKSDNLVLTVGGDHSLGLGSVAGALTNDPDLGLIWFDAHGDINNETSSPSANAHGMPVAALMGLCNSALNDVATVHIKPQNVFWVGARNLDEGEEGILRKNGIYSNVYSSAEVHRRGMSVVMDEIRDRMREQGIKTIHLSFDIDGMDPSIVIATGTMVKGGITQEELDIFISSLHELPTMRSIDFVEYNPLLDDVEKATGRWCATTIRQLVEAQ